MNYKLDGLIVNHSYILPDPPAKAIEAQFGSAPAPAYPNTGRNHYATDVLTRYILSDMQSNLIYVWMSDPDHT